MASTGAEGFYLYFACGGGGVITLKVCGIPIKKTRVYSYTLNQNPWFKGTLPILQREDALERLQKLTSGMDKQSAQRVYQIFSRTIKAEQNPKGTITLLTAQEIKARDAIATEFYPNISHLTPNVYYWNGYFLPKRHGVETFWYNHGLHMLKNLEVLRDKDIVDVGGYIGDSALILQDYTDRSVYSFEATMTNYSLMLQTIALNNASRIVPVNKALGSQSGKATISLYGGASSFNTTHQFIADGSKANEEAEIIALDSYVQEHKLKVGLIKVDIEGFEMEFLAGAKESICTQKPTLLISIYHHIEHFFEIKPLIESWNLGYTFSIWKPIDENISAETMLICEIL